VIILGIESSCDETAAAVVATVPGRGNPRLLSSIVASQMAVHRPYGGVVPELASRSHIRFITEVVDAALTKARIPLRRLDGVAATAGPGLAGSLLVGLTSGKALAFLLRKPFLAVNHIEAHIYAAFLESPGLRPPLLALVASGGHTELIAMPRHGVFTILGRTRDDAAGEAYDKVAKLLGLGFPGGPRLEKFARRATSADRLPVARMKDGSLNFSFSGLKTAVANLAPGSRDRAGLAAGFQQAVIAALVGQTRVALDRSRARTLVLAGGVAANAAVRAAFQRLTAERRIGLAIPSMPLCTDNAAMIACAGWFRARAGRRDSLAVSAVADWDAGQPVPA